MGHDLESAPQSNQNQISLLKLRTTHADLSFVWLQPLAAAGAQPKIFLRPSASAATQQHCVASMQGFLPFLILDLASAQV